MNENDMTDEELAAHEEATKVVEDRWDRLDKFRKLLNSSRLEQMYVIKRSQRLGPLCPYYKTSLRLFQRDQEQQILEEMKRVLEEFTNER